MKSRMPGLYVTEIHGGSLTDWVKQRLKAPLPTNPAKKNQLTDDDSKEQNGQRKTGDTGDVTGKPKTLRERH